MGKSAKTTNNPLLQYHPIRYSQARTSFLEEAIKIYQLAFINSDIKTSSLTNKYMEQLYDIIHEAIAFHAKSSTSSDAFPKFIKLLITSQTNSKLTELTLDKLINYELTLLKDYEYFSQLGSNIFEFSSHLIDLFWDTDVEDVLIEDIKLPFPSLYLHFGKQPGKTVNSFLKTIQQKVYERDGKKDDFRECLLDGAYITQSPNSNEIEILLTGVLDKRLKYNNLIDCYEDVQEICLEQDNSVTTVGEAILKAKNESIKRSNQSLSQYFVDGKTNFNIIQNVSQERQTSINSSYDAIAEYLKLVINCLLYLQSYPEEVVEEYPTEAPANLVSQTKRTSAVKDVAQRKLNELGFRKIKFCGGKKQQFEKFVDNVDSEPSTSIDGDKRTVSPHKRRAHLRKQRYGQRLKSWRYVWIRELTIHEDKYKNSPQQYRIYEVDDK